MSLESIPSLLQRAGAQVIVRDWLSSNQVVFADRDLGGTVVDTGHVTRSAQTVALVQHALADLGLARIIHTHLHSDHCGGSAALQQRWPAATIAVPAGYREHLEVVDEEGAYFRPMGQQCGQFRPGVYLQVGQSIECAPSGWECHSAPGHDPYALMFFQPENRLLISGDALWQDRLAIIFPALTGSDGFDAAHVALDTIERLGPVVVIPGHGEPFADVARALRKSRQRLEAFAADPERHRRYSQRVMVAYHLLERHEVEPEALVQWVVDTPIVGRALGCPVGSPPTRQQAQELLDGMIVDQILEADHTRIRLLAR